MFLKISIEYEDTLKVERWDYLGIITLPETEYYQFVRDNTALGIASTTTIDYFYDMYLSLVEWASTAKTGDYIFHQGNVWIRI